MKTRSRRDGEGTQGVPHMRVLIYLNIFCFLFFASAAIAFLTSRSPHETNVATASARVMVERDPPIADAQVLLPQQEIAAGEPLAPELFRRESRPAATISEHMITDADDLRGSFARSKIAVGEPLTRELLTRARPTSGAIANIPDGYRAVPVTIDLKGGLDRWLRPGVRVDVSWLTENLGKRALSVIVENALILSADRSAAPQIKNSAPVLSTVMLLVTAKDAAKVQLASSTGGLSLSLRGETDESRNDGSADLTVKDLVQSRVERGSTMKKPGSTVEGYARYKRADGSDAEMVIMGGALVPRSQQ